jgi:3-oxoacyl-[acyl-carrier protein] reductase
MHEQENTKMRLKDKVCIVTGSASGIGKAIAVKMAREGAKVALCDIDEAALAEAEKEIKALGAAVKTFKVDVAKRVDVEAMVAGVAAAWQRVDCMAANAGILMDAQLGKMTDEQWDKVIGVNLKGVFNCGRAVADIMFAQRSGVILVTSSIAGLYGNFGQTNYAATKAGVIAMVKTWGKELGRKGVRAVAVCPGMVETPIIASMPEKVIEFAKQRIPLGRFGTVEEIANVFAFLASDEAGYINGVAIEVGGGMVV